MLGWQRGLARVGIHTPFGRDAVGAALVLMGDLGLGAVGYALVDNDAQASIPFFAASLLLVAIADGALAWRRRRPVTVLAIAFLVLLVSGVHSSTVAIVVGPVVATYTVGSRCRLGSSILLLGTGTVALPLFAALLLVVPTLPLGEEPEAGPFIFSAVWAAAWVILVPGLAGAGIVRQRERRARQAVTAERGRIARELHDVAAHHLSSMVVQAGVAERRIDNDSEHAREVLAAIREQGSTTLAQMRQIVGALREDEGDGAAPPTLRQGQQLVDEARGAGCQVSLQIEDQRPSSLPPAADFAGYRVLQESLTNARRHAPGATVIARVAYGRDAVEVEVGNTAPPDDALPAVESDGGHGLTGMRERVSLAGGELTAGPTDDGGWRVHAVLPTAEPATGGETHRAGASSAPAEPGVEVSGFAASFDVDTTSDSTKADDSSADPHEHARQEVTS